MLVLGPLGAAHKILPGWGGKAAEAEVVCSVPTDVWRGDSQTACRHPQSVWSWVTKDAGRSSLVMALTAVRSTLSHPYISGGLPRESHFGTVLTRLQEPVTAATACGRIGGLFSRETTELRKRSPRRSPR